MEGDTERQAQLLGLTPGKRRLYLYLGHTSLLLGFIGLLLPLVPTSPFVILSASLYARSSRRFYNMLVKNAMFGPIIVDWEKNRCLKLKVKLVALFSLLLAFSATWYLFVETFLSQLFVLLLGLIFMILVLLIPTCERRKNDAPL